MSLLTSKNLPNILTLFRIFLTAIFLLFLLGGGGILSKSGALLAFLLASLTDYWDGKIAREMGTTSNFGKLMDPIADKILTLSAFIAFVQMNILPAWMVVAIITRDLLITGSRLLVPSDDKRLDVRQSGKHKTVIQFVAILVILLFTIGQEMTFWNPDWTPGALQFIQTAMVFVVGFTLWTGIRHLIKNKDVFLGKNE